MACYLRQQDTGGYRLFLMERGAVPTNLDTANSIVADASVLSAYFSV
jgi:hypothetical protein